MKITKKLVLVWLLGIMFCCQVIAVPWTDTTRFEFNLDQKKNRIWVNRYPTIVKNYENRFGAFPNIMLWKDDVQPRTISWGISYYISHKDFENHSPWKKPIVWHDVKDFCYFKLKNLKTGTETFIHSENGISNDTLEFEDFYTTGWSTRLNIDAWSLPLEEGVAYEILPVVLEGIPPNEKLVASARHPLVVVKANHTEPIDDYQDAFWGNKFSNNPELCVSLLNSFPFNDLIHMELFNHYYAHQNGDSLKWITAQMFYSLENRLDDFYIPQSYFGRNDPENDRLKMTPNLREYYLNLVQEVCGDTLLPPPWRTK